MNHLRRVEQNYYSSFQPSAYSGGIQPYQPPGAAYYGDLDAEELEDQKSYTGIYTLRDYVKSLDDYSVTALTNLGTLRMGAEMRQVAGNNAEAYLKVAYWLKVAWLASGGAWSKVDSLKAASDGALTSGVSSGEKAGSLYDYSRVNRIYSDALVALQRETAAFKSNAQVYSELVSILGEGTKSAAVEESREQAEDEAASGAEGREMAECESSWLSFIPGYCENRFLFKVIGGTVMTTIGLVAARGVYKQVMAFKREVEK